MKEHVKKYWEDLIDKVFWYSDKVKFAEANLAWGADRDDIEVLEYVEYPFKSKGWMDMNGEWTYGEPDNDMPEFLILYIDSFF